MVESGVEGFTTYNFLISNWGNQLILAVPVFPLVVLVDLQPLFDALRKCSITSQRPFNVDCPLLSSCSIRTVLLYVEDLDIL
jgi:hypothetical protein